MKPKDDHQRVVRVKEVVQELERLRHRAVILDALSAHAMHMFHAIDGEPPRYLIANVNGGTGTALPDVVSVVAAELEEMAERARDRYAETCAGVVSGLPEPAPYKAPSQKPRPTKQGGGASGKAVRNPRTASGNRGRLP